MSAFAGMGFTINSKGIGLEISKDIEDVVA
jgi:predicted naringenin-chalcone synthase